MQAHQIIGRGVMKMTGSVAEWSKALVLGTSLSGRGFESHRCQTFFLCSYDRSTPEMVSWGR